MTSDLIESDDQEVNEPAPTGFNKDSIYISNKCWSVESLILAYTKDKRIKTPSLQRKYEWKLDRQQAFIDSLLAGCPTPSLLLAIDRKSNHDLYILDGFQRTNSIIRFMSDQFRTSSTNPDLPECQAKLWSELSTKHQNIITQTDLPVLEVTAERQFWGFIFRQINRGGVPLKPAAVWRAFYDVKLLSHLDSFAEKNEVWLSVFGRNDGYRGLKTLVRALAMHFAVETYPNFKSMAQFLDQYCFNMKNTKYNTNLLMERLDLIIEAIHLKPGKLAFRTKETKGPSPSLIDCVLHAGFIITQQSPKISPTKLGAILSQIRDDLVNIPENYDLLTFQTSSKANVATRMEVTFELVKKHTGKVK